MVAMLNKKALHIGIEWLHNRLTSFTYWHSILLNWCIITKSQQLSGHLKVVRTERAVLKPKFWNEWMNEKDILGFKLCTEVEKNFQTPWQLFEQAVPNLASRNGLKPTTAPISSTAISQEMPPPSITKIRLKITYLKFHSNFPGTNELTLFHIYSMSHMCPGPTFTNMD